jgi:integrase
MSNAIGSSATTVLTTVDGVRPPLGVPKRHRRGRRGNNEGTIVQRTDGRWAGAVTVGPGKRRWFYGKTREEVARRLTQALKAAQDGIPIPGESETVERFLTRWLAESVTNRVRPSTFISYASLVRLHLIPEVGKVRLARLTPSQVQSLLNKKLASGLSPRRVEYVRSVLRQALGHALRWNLVSRNVAALTDRPRPVRKEIRPLDIEQAQRFLEAVRGDRLEALYSVAQALGVRQGEALGLRWEDLDLDHGFMHIRRSLVRLNGEFVLTEPKTTRSARKLGPLPDMLIETLRAHRLRQTKEKLAAPAWHNDWDLVFTTPTGGPWHSSTITKTFQAHLAAAGLPRQRFHDLRHGCASLLLAQGVNPRVVMEILGHSQITLTLDTYSHVTQSVQGEALAALATALSPAR